MFSPYYAWAGRADPLDHCAVNVALYGRPGRWAMTERGSVAVARSADTLSIGRSTIRWAGDALELDVDEVAVPHLTRLRGRIRLHPAGLAGVGLALDPDARHCWWPVAPVARAEIAFDRPDLHWTGDAYHDANAGAEPLEAGFSRWHWMRAAVPGGAAVTYEAEPRQGPARTVALRFRADGAAEPFEPPPPVRLPKTSWRVGRTMRAEAGPPPRVLRTLEDAPFYARTLVAGRLLGGDVAAVHESLDLDRFARAPGRTRPTARCPR